MGGIGILALVLLSVASLDSYRDLKAGRGQEADLNQRIAATDGRIEELEAQVEGLREDPAMLERLAREELMMARPGEVVIVLPASELERAPGPDEGAATATPAVARGEGGV